MDIKFALVTFDYIFPCDSTQYFKFMSFLDDLEVKTSTKYLGDLLATYTCIDGQNKLVALQWGKDCDLN